MHFGVKLLTIKRIEEERKGLAWLNEILTEAGLEIWLSEKANFYGFYSTSSLSIGLVILWSKSNRLKLFKMNVYPGQHKLLYSYSDTYLKCGEKTND